MKSVAGSETLIIAPGKMFEQILTDPTGVTTRTKGRWDISNGNVVLYDIMDYVDMDGAVKKDPKAGVAIFTFYGSYMEVWGEGGPKSYHWRYDKK